MPQFSDTDLLLTPQDKISQLNNLMIATTFWIEEYVLTQDKVALDNAVELITASCALSEDVCAHMEYLSTGPHVIRVPAALMQRFFEINNSDDYRQNLAVVHTNNTPM